MKNIILKIFTLILSSIIMSGCMLSSIQADENRKMKGIWISTIYNLDYPKTQTTNSESLKSQADNILDNCKEMGFNTIFFQVRPSSDALYKSEIYPWSKWLTGEQGVSPTNDFDPLEYWIEEAHKRGMELHAWINPYRITKANDDNDTEYNSLDPSNPAKTLSQYIIKHTDKNYYFDPAVPAVRELVINGAVEIVKNYDIDGIHMDDYFYPSSDFPDNSSFEKYKGSFQDKGDWRRNNVNLLIQGLDEAIHNEKPDIQFGISPSGIWANKSNNPLGSDTNGNESYYSLYADTRKWAIEGWIDYIAPQIYWNIGHSSADYSKISAWWADTLKNCDTKLYIGIADYRSLDAGSSSPWYNGSEVKKQIELNKKNDKIDGEIHFRYDCIMGVPALRNLIKEEYNNESNSNVSVLPSDDETNSNIPTNPIVSEPPNTNNNSGNREVTVFVDGLQIEFDQKPVIENSRVLVPLRAIFEAIGAEVEWFPKTENIVARSKLGKEIILQVGSDVMSINGTEKITLDVPAKIIGSRTLVPLRAVSEALDANVDWNGTDYIVTITTK